MSYATFGIIAKDNRVIHAPPIAYWMIGKTLDKIRIFVIQRKAEVKEIK